MMTTTPRALRSAAVALALACAHATPHGVVGTEPAGSALAPSLTEAEYVRTLPPPPIVVGFDVDDTALFSTPAFLYALGRLVPEPPAPSGTAEEQVATWRRWVETLDERRLALFQKLVGTDGSGLTDHERRQWVQFWVDVNGKGDTFSPPKLLVRSLVQRHLARGDEVVFVTGRAKAGSELLTAKLRAEFGSDRLRVEFTGNGPKVESMRRLGVVVYYGDADGDMTDAAAAGARGVRILRSRYSSNTGGVSPGAKGEWCVIRDSDR